MATEDSNTLDLIVESAHTRGLDLLLAGNGDIKDEVRRFHLVLEKLVSYMNFVISGQLAAQHPESQAGGVRFCVIWNSSPPNEAMQKITAIQPGNDPSRRFPVVLMTQEEYLSEGKGN
jgi:hypothetical protein